MSSDQSTTTSAQGTAIEATEKVNPTAATSKTVDESDGGDNEKSKQQQQKPPGGDGKEEAGDVPNMSLLDITEGNNDRGIPKAKFIDDVGKFSDTFDPPAPAELLIGAYSDLMTKYRTYEAQLQQRQLRLKEKVPELEKSLSLVRTLMEKQQKAKETDDDDDDVAKGMARFSLADNIYAKAEIDYKNNEIVNLWLGANVMLEFTYQEAIDFLSQNQERAKNEQKETLHDLAYVRDQIVTSEVTMSRIYNWDVRRKRNTTSPQPPSGAPVAAVSKA